MSVYVHVLLATVNEAGDYDCEALGSEEPHASEGMWLVRQYRDIPAANWPAFRCGVEETSGTQVVMRGDG